jgi:Cu2+-exporting ATPase
MTTTRHHDAAEPMGHRAPDDVAPVLTVDLHNCYDGTEYAGLEDAVQKLPGVTTVHLDRTRGVLHIGYDPAVTRAADLEEALHRTG